jgi:hypothetical protein
MPDAHDRIVAALEAKGLWTGDPAHAKCPVPEHEDRRGSLSVGRGGDGALVKCHAGCDTKDVVAALDLTLSDLYDDAGSRRNGDGIEAVYVYADESGVPLYEVVRFVGKDFRPRLPGADRFGIGTTRRVLFNLPRVLEAVRAGRAVHFCEGEKDALALQAALDEQGTGAVATCHAFGAKSWRDEYAAVLGDATVIVYADKDSEGRAWARTVRAALERVGASVIVVEAAAGKDAHDHFAAGFGLLDFVPWESADGPVAVYVGAVDGATFALEAAEHVEAVWGEKSSVLWSEGEPFMVVAPDGAGKTTLGQQLALRRGGVGGDELLGLPVARSHGRVLYVAADRPRQAARSMRRMVTSSDREALLAGLIVWRGALPFDLVKEPGRLAEWASELGAGTVVIDSLKDVLTKLSEEDTGLAFNAAMQGCAAASIEVASLHHQRKAQGDNKKPRTLADVYGSRWLTAACGSVVLLWGDAGDPIVEMVHLKPADDVVGPWTLLHDNRRGTTTVTDKRDLLTIVAKAGVEGATARGVASATASKSKPSGAEVERARRRLEAEVEAGRLVREDPSTPNDPARYRLKS